DRPPPACAHEARRLHRQRLASRRDQPHRPDRGAAVRPSRRLRARSAIRGAGPRRRRAAAIRQCDADAAYCRAAALQRTRRFRRYDRGAGPGGTRMIRFALALSISGLAASAAVAQDTAWPTKPVRLIAPFPAASTVDVVARV